MDAIVGVYDTHDKAVEALHSLQNEGFSLSQVSLLTKSDLINDHLSVDSNHTTEVAELSLGIVAGTVLGMLAGIGMLAIPGLGFLYGAGALAGAVAGAEMGIVGGGLAAILTRIGISVAYTSDYEKHLNEGNFLLFIQGTDEEQKKAQEILHTTNLHVKLDRG